MFLPSRLLLRVLLVLAAVIILGALAYGLRVHVVGEPAARDPGVMVVGATAAAPPPGGPLLTPPQRPGGAPRPESETSTPPAPTAAAGIERIEAEARARSRERMAERAAARGMSLSDLTVD